MPVAGDLHAGGALQQVGVRPGQRGQSGLAPVRSQLGGQQPGPHRCRRRSANASVSGAFNGTTACYTQAEADHEG